MSVQTIEEVRQYLQSKVVNYNKQISKLEQELRENPENIQLVIQINSLKWIRQDTYETYVDLFRK